MSSNVVNPSQGQPDANPLFNLMERINRLNIKAFESQSLESLIFIILNDTGHVVRYDRAVLWDLTKKRPALLGVSGQAKLNKDAEISQKWITAINAIPDIGKAQQLNAAIFKEKDKDNWENLQKQTKAAVIWLPIIIDNKLTAGLWIENWEASERDLTQIAGLLNAYLIPGYAAAWQKVSKRSGIKKVGLIRHKFLLTSLAIAGLLFFVHLPLRIVAHCEVVPKDPYLIAAPLEGIVENVLVQPGKFVKKGQPLFEYDKRAPLHDLKAAQKDVQVMQAEVARASTLGLSDPRSLKELGVLKLKLEKGLVQLDLAEYRASQLTVSAPEAGVVMLDNPDEWRGKPVKVGEKVMIISDPKQTKLKLWIPEDDNIALEEKTPINIYLNIDPDKSWDAHLDYIANESSINDKNMVTFVAEAEWVKTPPDAKLGLKGTAVLYGEKVSLFYYIFRKPWAHLRALLGF